MFRINLLLNMFRILFKTMLLLNRFRKIQLSQWNVQQGRKIPQSPLLLLNLIISFRIIYKFCKQLCTLSTLAIEPQLLLSEQIPKYCCYTVLYWSKYIIIACDILRRFSIINNFMDAFLGSVCSFKVLGSVYEYRIQV